MSTWKTNQSMGGHDVEQQRNVEGWKDAKKSCIAEVDETHEKQIVATQPSSFTLPGGHRKNQTQGAARGAQPRTRPNQQGKLTRTRGESKLRSLR
mmetsp:Transcript_4746/g.30020  ORF Transcript_4746/g.30020 Transcript_4746/m.30020 type:complete len:95 (-) Transcript_4746:1878-2162(-)